MKKWAFFALLSVFLLGLIMRILPLTSYAVWGSDTGEYYYLTKSLVENHYISFDYSGWGFGYPYFPGMFVLTGSAEFLGFNLMDVLLILTPVISGLSVILIFFITKNVFKDDRIGIVSALLFAVAIPHVFTTSHPMPGSLGDFLLLFCVFLFLKTYKNKNFILLLVPSATALIVTHHLSSYFLFISILFFVFIRELVQKSSDKKKLWIEIPFLGFLFATMMIQWLWIAKPFENIIYDAFKIKSLIIAVLSCLAFSALPIIVFLRRKIPYTYKPKHPTYKGMLIKYCAAIAVSFPILMMAVFVKVPGTTITIDKSSIILFAPTIILFSFCVIGTGFSDFYKNGNFLFCWLGAISLSMLVGVVTDNTVLIPYRHLQYIVVPLVMFAGVGIVKFYDGCKRNNLKNAFFACLFAMLLVLAPFSCYPPANVLGGFEEGTDYRDMEAVFWVKENLPDATIASDHRMSSMLFGFADTSPTWEYAPIVFHSSSFNESKDELLKCHTPSGEKRIDYVFIDKTMKEKGVALSQYENAEPMSTQSIEKFNHEPFVKIYDNGYVQIYRIDW
ncbi:MAG: hypothetical protein KKB04_00490 [Candidatus Thermoplasmatota archaeon]|nr:hypothetical protein [Candidatus Thermoplasmatota archaeon]